MKIKKHPGWQQLTSFQAGIKKPLSGIRTIGLGSIIPKPVPTENFTNNTTLD
jgi:hypothetical protein